MKRTFRQRIESLGLNYNLEITIIVSLCIIGIASGVAIYFFLNQLVIALFAGLIGITLSFFYSTRYSKLEKKLEKDHVDEFISLLSYLEIFINNKNNVYTSFKMLLPYCSTYMDDAINSMLDQIDVDKTVGPYINFASKFNSHVIESLMLSIYQIVDNGEGIGQFNEFDLLFTNIREKYQEDLIDSKKKALEVFNSFPLIGAGAITIVLSMSIISMIGDFINVI